MANNPFFIPNGDRNCKLEEQPHGLTMSYVLPCDKNYPNKTFQSKNRWYVRRKHYIPYDSFMSDKIMRTYMFLKNSTMLELNLWNYQMLTNKIIKLQNNLNNL